MTVNFVPGEVNGTETSVLHGRWKNHYVIVYGSGNNLIISAITSKNGETFQHLQTLYLESDPTSVDFNNITAYIAITINSKIHIFKPLNEYMSKPQWTEALTIDVNSINDDSNDDDCETLSCLQWAPLEQELVVASNNCISLFWIYEEYGQLNFLRRWHQRQPLPVSTVKITYNANKIVAKYSQVDRLLKVWSRITYDNENTMFELCYLQHPKNDFVVDFRWRFRVYNESINKLDSSMANIKNIRNYIDAASTSDTNTLFSFTNNQVFRVWSTYESNGHNSIKCWGELDLSQCFYEEKLVSIMVIDNYYLIKALFKNLRDLPESDLVNYFRDKRFDNVDLLLAISESGRVAIFLIMNISSIPPNSIKFERIDNTLMKFNQFGFLTVDVKPFDNPTLSDLNSYKFLQSVTPVIIPKTTFLTESENLLSIVIHNRVKNTLKLNSLDFRKLLAPGTSNIGTELLNKFQGHEKSIRRLIKSISYSGQGNLLLSTLSFAKYNYIWEPIEFKISKVSHKSITKRFRIDLTKSDPDENNYIIDTAIINDIEPTRKGKRHHLVLTVDTHSNLCLWDCDSNKNDDKPGELLRSEKVLHQIPQVFALTKAISYTDYKQFYLIIIYESKLIKAWTLKIYNGRLKIEMRKINIEHLPILNFHKLVKIESDSNDDGILSLIDDHGKYRIFKVKQENDGLIWVEMFSLETNIRNCTKIVGSFTINKLAVVDESGFKVYIWDLKANILEYEETFNTPIKDIDWCLIESPQYSTSNTVLSIGFLRVVLLYSELRYDYTNNIPTYTNVKKIDISDYTSHEIGDSIWLNGGYLVIGSGNQFFIDDRWVEIGGSSSNFMNTTIKELISGYINDESSKETFIDLSNMVKILNGPLPIYHPQFLIQLLYINKFDLVKRIIVKLFQVIRSNKPISWNLGIDVIDLIYFENELEEKKNELFTSESVDIFNSFNDNLINLLSERLTKISLPLLTRHQQITLTSFINIGKFLNSYYNLLDENGTKFLVGFKLFQQSSKQNALNMRDIVFALHSAHKDLLMNIVDESYSYKYDLNLVKSLGLVYWVNNEKLLEIIEQIIKSQFSDSRDPSGLISLIYLTLNRKQVLLGLWKIVNHKEKGKMVKFLSNDFKEKRWRTAALKNAYVLLGQHRYIDAAYFFLLSDNILDCCNILVNKVQDFQLALIVLKLYCHSRRQPYDPKKLFTSSLLVDAVQRGDSWVISYILWELNMKELSVEALIRPPREIIGKTDLISSQNMMVKNSGKDILNNDPAVFTLFNQLKFKHVESSINHEFQFLVTATSMYNKMGCDIIAVISLKEYQFYQSSNKKEVRETEPKEENNGLIKPPVAAFEEPDMSSFDFGF